MGIEGDVDSFNPLFAEDVTAGELNDLFYPSLTGSRFNHEQGVLEYRPLLAASWEFSNDGKDITFHLRTDAKWSDGVAVNARDVQLSYELYADTNVASVRQHSVEGLLTSRDGTLDVRKAVETIDDSTVRFHFSRPSAGQLFDAGLPILPSHVFGRLPDRKMLHEDSLNRHPSSAGPFILKEWKPMEQIELMPNPSSVLPHAAKVPKLVFRIIPDYSSRMMQLLSGEIDVLPYINVDDAFKVQEGVEPIDIVPLGERFYDAINWNNIDPDVFERSKGVQIVPHPLFGSATVRRALTMAINRREIVDSYLRTYGREAFGPVSPLFRWAYNDTLQQIPFDQAAARVLLAGEGWKDSDGDGLLEKNGRRFSFTLKVPSGNQLRSTIATIVQARLRAVGIELNIQHLERAVFWGDIMEKKFDACIAGFSVPLQLQLDEMWGGDLEKSRFNITSFRNKRIDEILILTKHLRRDTDGAGAWKEFQTILQLEQPCTFLYWMNDLVAVNRRVKNTQMGVLGVLYQAGEWSLK